MAIVPPGVLPTVDGGWQLILCDPPWAFEVWKRVAGDPNPRTPDRYYPTMSGAVISELPVRAVAAPDSVLLLWATMPMLPEALRVMEAWGFRYKTAVFTWVKANENGDPFMGLGYYTRANAELCLLGTKGKGLTRRNKDVPSVLVSRRREHSRKPDGQYDYITRLFGTDIRRIELFARQAWPGWMAWGFDVPCAATLALPFDTSMATVSGASIAP